MAVQKSRKTIQARHASLSFRAALPAVRSTPRAGDSFPSPNFPREDFYRGRKVLQTKADAQRPEE